MFPYNRSTGHTRAQINPTPVNRKEARLGLRFLRLMRHTSAARSRPFAQNPLTWGRFSPYWLNRE